MMPTEGVLVASGIYIKAQGKEFGPYPEAELLGHIKAGRIPFSSWVFQAGQWKLFAELPELRAHHPEYELMPAEAPLAKSAEKNLSELVPPPAARAMSIAEIVSADTIWFLIRDKKKFGPYSAAEIIGQLQRKQIEPSAFVWRPGFPTWQRMSQVAEFSRASMKRLAGDGTPVDILVKRKFLRAPYEVEVIAHDNTRALEGKSMVIGEGGLFLATPRPLHRVGSRLRLHFREGKSSSFNAVAEVVSVVRGEQPGYCMRFVALTDGDRKRIARFVSDKK